MWTCKERVGESGSLFEDSILALAYEENSDVIIDPNLDKAGKLLLFYKIISIQTTYDRIKNICQYLVY